MKSSPWPDVAIGAHVDLLTGFPFKSDRYTSDASDVPLLRGDNIGQGFLRWDGVKRWPQREADSHDKFALEVGDVILAMDRPWIDAGLKWAAVRADDLPVLLVQRVARMRGVNGLLTAFLKYVIAAPGFTEYVKSITTGVNVPHISGPDIRKHTFRLPTPGVQRRIADILSAYDDLIENNTKRIKILEEMARSLYREWFVNFRFPGHGKVSLVDSSIGKVPAGWKSVALDTLCDYVNRGVAPKYADDGAGWVINQKCVRDQRLSRAPARRHASTVPPDKYVRKGDVLINSTGVGTLGRVAQVLEELDGFTVDTHVSIVRPVGGVDPHYFGATLLAKAAYFAAQGVGSTGQTELSRARIGATEVLSPPLALQQRFGDVVREIREAPVTLLKKNENLRATRDLLLPRLISGELDVSTLRDPLG